MSDADKGPAASLSEALRDAHSRLRKLPMDAARRAVLQRRLIAITNAAKHDTTTAARRLAAFLTELDQQPPDH